jgi:hypothetical protein
MQQSFGKVRVTEQHLQLPHAKPPHLSLYGQENRRGMAVYAGCFYCVCQKHGQVFVRSTAMPHVDFQVKHDWVFRLLSAQKISPDVARQHFVQIVTRCPTNMADLQFAEEFLARQSEEAERAVILAKIISNSKPYRDLPEVHAWATQYDSEKPLDRYKFLVLEGPSSIGKTRFVQGALVDKPEKALILDCSDAVVPALKSNFSRQKHTLVMFDEAHASMIIRCKKKIRHRSTQFPTEAAPPMPSCTRCGCMASNSWWLQMFGQKRCCPLLPLTDNGSKAILFTSKQTGHCSYSDAGQLHEQSTIELGDTQESLFYRT